jgi:hypothetical protein
MILMKPGHNCDPISILPLGSRFLKMTNHSYPVTVCNTSVYLFLIMKVRHQRGLGSLRRSYAVHAFVALLLFAIAGRTGSDFFHTHEALIDNGPTISAPCNACDVEATVTLNAPPIPVLPPLTVTPVEIFASSVIRPFAPAILHTQGRAPPTL